MGNASSVRDQPMASGQNHRLVPVESNNSRFPTVTCFIWRFPEKQAPKTPSHHPDMMGFSHGKKQQPFRVRCCSSRWWPHGILHGRSQIRRGWRRNETCQTRQGGCCAVATVKVGDFVTSVTKKVIELIEPCNHRGVFLFRCFFPLW